MKVLPVLALLVAGAYATDEDAAIPEELRTRTHLRAAEVMQIKDDFWRTHEDEIGAAETKLSVRNQKTPCVNGIASVGGVNYPCDKVDFLSLIGRAELMRDRKNFNDRTKRMSDIWGWQSPNTGREYTISCMTNVLWFIDSTDALNPKPLAWMESHRAESSWCDTKVYKNTAYVVQDRSASGGNDKGVQVFDLLRLEKDPIVNSAQPILVAPDYTYDRHGAVHNLVIDTDSGFLYSVGTSGGTSCSGGLHMIDLNNDRLKPEFAGCASMDGYVHDAQCVVYEGPDSRYTGSQICFGYNEDSLTIYDVTDKSRPVVLSKTKYGTSRYTHQGWLNKDQDFVMLNDELDEQYGSVGNTRSYIVDVSDLENPRFTGFFDHGVRSIDHNMYFFGDMHARGWGGNPAMRNPPNPDYVYCSNYASGLRIVDTTNIKDTNPSLSLAGYFDVSPSVSGNQFLGVWSAYMHPSGVIALNVIETGVMFVEFEDAFAPVNRDAAPEKADGTAEESTPVNGYAVAFWVTALGFLVAAVAYVAHLRYKSNENREESAAPQINPRQVAKENLEKSRVGNPMFEVEGQQV